jgi:hypothetical protein
LCRRLLPYYWRRNSFAKRRWLGGTFGGAVLQARLVDIGAVSDIDPPWIITIGSSLIGFFAGAYAAVKLDDLKLRKK